jgi:hypothetical protein
MHPQEQINLYIAEQPEWQRKVMVRLRQLMHQAHEGIEETWRGNAPHFEHQGAMVGLHAFKTCVSVWFHKGALLKDTHGLFKLSEKDADRTLRKYKIFEADTLQEKAFTDLVKQAVKLNESGAKPGEKPVRKALVVPPELESGLKKDEQAWENWGKFSLAHKKEYVEWIDDAKQEETRKRRIAKALEMIREGQVKNDAYTVG